jgi:hypothetical protein
MEKEPHLSQTSTNRSVESILGTREASAESVKTLEQLNEFLAQGYVLHGSKHKFDVATPHPSEDIDKTRTIGNLDAVYGTTEHVEISLFMAMKGIKDPSGPSPLSGYSGTNGSFVVRGDSNTALSTGYVYVLPSDTFEIVKDENHEELVSFVPVMPHAVFRVEPDILNLFPNVTFDFK